MPFTTLVEKGLLGLELGDVTPSIPSTHYVGLISAATWAPTTAYTTTNYVVPTLFNSGSGSVGRIFKCTSAGTSSGTQPTWPVTAGGTVSDGTVTWTEVSVLFAAGTFTNAEPSGGSYARVGVVNNTTNWPTPTGGNPAQVQNGTTITFPTTTASWGQIVGFALFDSSVSGNARMWGCLSTTSAVATVVGVTPDFAVSGITAQLT